MEIGDEVVKGLEIATLEDIDILFNIGLNFINKRKYNLARKIFQKITQLAPKSRDGWFQYGRVFIGLGLYDQAIRCFDRVLELNHKDTQAWVNKGIILGILDNYEDAIKCFDKAIKLDVDYPFSWYNKGYLLTKIGKYDAAIECFTKTIQLEPKYSGAWLTKCFALNKLGRYEEAIGFLDYCIKINPDEKILWLYKGIALFGLSKYDQAIKCYERAIELDFNYAEAWFRKGFILSLIKKYDESIECYEKAILIDPVYAEAYGNKGISLLYKHQYDESELQLKKASEVFFRKGLTKDAEIALEYATWVRNSKELMERLRPIDDEFKNSMISDNLIHIKDKIAKIIEEFRELANLFKERKIVENAKELLISKEICINSLYEALNCHQVDSEKLDYAKKIFNKWNLDEYIVIINSIENFSISINKYRNLREIPNDIEISLLTTLRSFCVLDGKLTKESFSRFELAPYGTEIKMKDEIKINNITLPNNMIKGESVRVCLVQLDFAITETFPYKLKDAGKVMEKILCALEIASQEKANIICFPELSSSEEFINKAKQYKNMIIILGTFYKNNFNVCPVIIGGQEHFVYKIHPSPNLENEIAPGKGIKSGKDIKIFSSDNNKFRFVVLVCLDYIEENRRFKNRDKEDDRISFIFNPCFNNDVKGFQKDADQLCRYFLVDTLQTNVKECNGMDYGGTSIIGVEHKNVIERLISEGYRQNDGIEYKLCEAKGEMMIIADLYLRGIEVPTHVRSKPRIRINGGYIYKDKIWEKVDPPFWLSSKK